MTEEKRIDPYDVSGLGELLEKFSKEMKENPIKIESDFTYPMEISGIEKRKLNMNNSKTGSLVKIRPCSKDYGNKTYLGIYIGDIPVEFNIGLYIKTNMLSILSTTNPAIFVPELKKIIFGYESWWGEIQSEEELNEITDNDINNVWYVKLLQQMSKEDTEDEVE